MKHTDVRRRWQRALDYLAIEEPEIYQSLLELSETLALDSIRLKRVAEGTQIPTGPVPHPKKSSV